jgi:hypothetical protein
VHIDSQKLDSLHIQTGNFSSVTLVLFQVEHCFSHETVFFDFGGENLLFQGLEQDTDIKLLSVIPLAELDSC